MLLVMLCFVQGLPSDEMSITSAILTVHSQQVPLCIDPHQQVESWLRFKLAPGLSIVSATEPSMLRVVQQCARVGAPCLVTSLSNPLDPALLPFLSHSPPRSGGENRVQSSSASMYVAMPSYSRNERASGFELYLTTQLADPRLAPATSLLLSVINFAALQVVWEQLLVDTIRHEKPSLEASAEMLANKLATDMRALRTHEEHTLHLLQVSLRIYEHLNVQLYHCSNADALVLEHIPLVRCSSVPPS